MVRLVSERLRRLTEQIADALALPPQARLAKALLYLAALQPAGPQGGCEPLRVSQSELGAMAGLRDLDQRSPMRVHVWKDPALAARAAS